MKNFKKMMALVIACIMVIGMALPTMAAAGDYTITVSNPGANATINGCTFSAIKLFDVDYEVNGDAVSYKTTTSNYFLTNTSAKTILEKYFTFTPAASDATKLAVTIGGTLNKTKDTLTASDMYDMTTALNNIDGLFAGAAVAATSPAATNDTAVIDVGEPGYYFVVGKGLETQVAEGDTPGEIIAATALTTAKPKATIKAKLEGPSIDKKIDTNKNKKVDTEDLTGNNKAIGDTVDYVIEGTVPNMTGYTKYFYIVTDNLSGGLTYKDDLAVTIDGKTMAEVNTALGLTGNNQIGYTVYYKLNTAADTAYATSLPTGYKAGDALDIKIVFNNFIALKGAVGDDGLYSSAFTGKNIDITYSAELNEKAIIGQTGNPNKAKLTYSTNPNKTPDSQTDEPGPKDVVGTTPEKDVVTYTTGIELTKVDTDTNKKLAGAKFRITGTALKKVVITTDTFEEADATYTGQKYWELNDGKYTTQDPNSDEVQNASNKAEILAKYKDTTKFYKPVKNSTVTTVSETVNAEATSGPDGVITFDGLAEGSYVITELVSPTGYNLLKDPLKLNVKWTAPTDNPITSTSTCTWTKSGDTTSDITFNENLGRFIVNVVNHTGIELPSTGGVGTTIFYIIGGILILGAAIALISKKKFAR